MLVDEKGQKVVLNTNMSLKINQNRGTLDEDDLKTANDYGKEGGVIEEDTGTEFERLEPDNHISER